MNDSIRLRRAGPLDQRAIWTLMTQSFGGETMLGDQAFWAWKHEVNPFGESPILIAESDEKIIGLRTFMRWRWNVRGVHVPAVRAVDTVTHPDYRGQGIFKRLTLGLRAEMEAEGVAFVYNTPNAQSRPGYLKMGWSLVGKPTLWVRPVRPLRLARGLRAEGLAGVEGEPPSVEAARAGDLLGETATADLVQVISRRVSSEQYHTSLRLDTLRWRYADVPGFEYVAQRSGEGDEGALVIARTRQRGPIRELRVCELLVGPAPGALANARRLLRDLSRSADVDVVLAMPPAVPGGRRLLARAGFVPVPRSGPILTVFPMNVPAGAPDPAALSSWRPSIGDLELF